MLDSLVRVSRRAIENHYVSILDKVADLSPQWAYYNKGYNTSEQAQKPLSLILFPSPKTDADLPRFRVHCLQVNSWSHQGKTGFQCFPFSNFTYYLTLFSKFFSSFDHSTCSLSVSRQYLALDEIHHPFRAAFPNNSTLRKRFIWQSTSAKDGVLTLSDVLFQGT